nr:hypothetical protein [Tanacetum cinerariifolium]
CLIVVTIVYEQTDILKNRRTSEKANHDHSKVLIPRSIVSFGIHVKWNNDGVGKRFIHIEDPSKLELKLEAEVYSSSRARAQYHAIILHNFLFCMYDMTE